MEDDYDHDDLKYEMRGFLYLTVICILQSVIVTTVVYLLWIMFYQAIVWKV